MVSHSKATRRTGALLGLLALLLVQAMAFAQPPDGGPPPGGPGGGPGGPGRRFGGPGGRGMSALNVPVAVLASSLKLTDTQKEKIAKIQKQFQQDRSKLIPARPTEQDAQPPDPETMRANFEKLARVEQTASKSVDALLTSDQKKALPAVLKDVQTLRMAGIPAEVMADLKLTADQKKQIASVVEKAQQAMRDKMQEARQSGDFDSMREVMTQSRQEMHTKAMAALTDDQRTLVEDYLKDHPQQEGGPGFGPPGGFGPPPGGAFGPPPGGGGPPPGANGDGPPPPGDDNAPPPPADVVILF